MMCSTSLAYTMIDLWNVNKFYYVLFYISSYIKSRELFFQLSKFAKDYINTKLYLIRCYAT